MFENINTDVGYLTVSGEKVRFCYNLKIYVNRGVGFGGLFQHSGFITDHCENHPLRKLQCTDRSYTDPLTYLITNWQHHCRQILLNTDELNLLKPSEARLTFFSDSKSSHFWKSNDIHFRTHRSGGWVQAHPGLKTLEIARADLSCINFSEFLYRLSKEVVQTQHERKAFTAVVGSLCTVCWCGPASSQDDELRLEE